MPPVYRGVYKGLNYESLLELATILHCEDRGFSIKNYDLGAIEYYDPIREQDRSYFPDFILNDFLIIEVKHLGWIYKKKKEEIESKRRALEYFCCANSNYACFFVSNKMINKKYIEAARKVHKEL